MVDELSFLYIAYSYSFPKRFTVWTIFVFPKLEWSRPNRHPQDFCQCFCPLPQTLGTIRTSSQIQVIKMIFLCRVAGLFLRNKLSCSHKEEPVERVHELSLDNSLRRSTVNVQLKSPWREARACWRNNVFQLALESSLKSWKSWLWKEMSGPPCSSC